MRAALIDVLHEAGVSCPELATWTACTWSDGRDDVCDGCAIGGPERCESQVIKALARKACELAGQADDALAQRDWALRQRDQAVSRERYWHSVVDRLCNVVMASESTRESHQKRHR